MNPVESGDEADADTELDDDAKIDKIKEILNLLVDGKIDIVSKATNLGDNTSCKMKDLFGSNFSWLPDFRKSKAFKCFAQANGISITGQGGYNYQTITIVNKRFQRSIPVLGKRKRNQNYVRKEKLSYSDKTIQENLKKCGLLKIFDDIKLIWLNYEFHNEKSKNEILRNQVFDSFLSKFQQISHMDDYRRDREIKNQSDKAIVASLNSALSELRCNSTGRISKTRLSNERKFAANILIRAASYKSGLSSKTLSNKLGIYETM